MDSRIRSHRSPDPLASHLLRAGLLGCLVLWLSPPALVGQATTPPGYEPIAQLMSGDNALRRRGLQELTSNPDPTLLPGLVDALFFTPSRLRIDLFKALEACSADKVKRSYYDWVEYIGSRPDIQPKEGYADWKLSLLMRIDPEFAKVFYPKAPSRIRLEEIVWGGVRLAGIPSLDDPPTLSASDATYLSDGEDVFGVSLGGEQRAYPVRILSWHELTNDVVGGEPIALSYCTLCGSAILYSTRTPAGGAYRFATSGLLYRSNKLMLDRESYSLWSNLTGEPVLGRMARTTARLPMLPVTRSTWGAWRKRFPQTRVVAIDRELGRQFGFDYTPGAADRQRSGVRFPVWQKSSALDRNEEVFALRLTDQARAYPLRTLYRDKVINDRLGDAELVIQGEPESGAVRAYRRSGQQFRQGADPEVLLDEAGRSWRIEEEALTPQGFEAAPLERLAGHIAFWFGWYGFYPQTSVYEGSAGGESR